MSVFSDLQHVDFSVIPQMYGINLKFEKIVYRAKIELELAFAQLLGPDETNYLEFDDNVRLYNTILCRVEDDRFCPEPPGGIRKTEHTLPNGETYYSIASLWDLMYLLDLDEAKWELRWQKCYCLPHLDYYNRSYYEYSEQGSEYIHYMEVYYVEDTGQYVMVESSWISY